MNDTKEILEGNTPTPAIETALSFVALAGLILGAICSLIILPQAPVGYELKAVAYLPPIAVMFGATTHCVFFLALECILKNMRG